MIPVDPSGPAAYQCLEAKPMQTLSTLPPAVHFPPVLFPAIRPGREVENEVKKPTQFKQGIVTVTEGQSPKRGLAFWELRYTDPDSGREVKRRVAGLNQDEVVAMAENLTRQAYTGRGHLAGKLPTIEEGIIEAVRISRGRDENKADLIKRGRLFITFLAARFPAVKTWAELKPGMMEAYLRELERAKLAYDTIRLRLAPIKAAWKRMNADYPERVKAPAAVKLPARPRREIICLEPGEVAILIDWLKAHAPDLWPMACLQGLAGLRVLEAAALRAQDVDLEAATVTITKTEKHTPKTRDSFRTIPVCGEVVEALKAAMAGQKKIRPAMGEIFTNEDGNLWSKDALTSRWRRSLNHISAKPQEIKRKGAGKRLTLHKHGLNMPRFGMIPARKLRAAFATMASKAGAPDRLLKAYLGHSSGDILGGHYRKIELDELRTVSGAMNGWREMGKAADAWKDSGDIRSMLSIQC